MTDINTTLVNQFTNIEAFFTKTLNEALQANLETKLQCKNEILRILAIKQIELLNTLIDKDLEEIASTKSEDEEFTIGFNKFKKVPNYANKKLDEAKLELIVPDKDNRALFYKITPKPQKDVEKQLSDLGLRISIDQIYTKGELKGYKIKPLN